MLLPLPVYVVSDFLDLWLDSRICIPCRLQVIQMLVVQGSYFENHCFKTSKKKLKFCEFLLSQISSEIKGGKLKILRMML